MAKNKEDINRQNVNNFILKTLDYYDANLSWFATCHIEILNNLKKELNRLYDNWDGLLRIENSNKVDIFEEKLIKYFDDNEPNTPVFSWNELEDYIIKKFKLEDIFECNAIYESYYCENDGKGLLEMKISDDKKNEIDGNDIYDNSCRNKIISNNNSLLNESLNTFTQNLNKKWKDLTKNDINNIKNRREKLYNDESSNNNIIENNTTLEYDKFEDEKIFDKVNQFTKVALNELKQSELSVFNKEKTIKKYN